MSKKIRVVMSKLGLDGHDLGAKMVAASLKNEGMEVIYTGRHQVPDQLVSIIMQEDVDVLGISILSGAHMGLMKRLMEKIRKEKIDDCLIVLGGLIPKSDQPELKKMGVDGVFSGGSNAKDIAEFIRENLKR